MKKLNLLAYPLISLLALLSAGAALAESPMPEDSTPQVWTQSKTRAQVQAELMQARADGSVKVWSTSYNALAQARSLKSRDEVRAELFAANRAGEVAALTGEDSGSVYLARRPVARDAAPLLARAR